MSRVRVIFESFLCQCENCKSSIVIEPKNMLTAIGRKFSFDGVEGHARCYNCGSLNEIKVDIKFQLDSKGFVCGDCKKTCEKLHDNYFCKDCYSKKLKEEIIDYDKDKKECKNKLDVLQKDGE